MVKNKNKNKPTKKKKKNTAVASFSPGFSKKFIPLKSLGLKTIKKEREKKSKHLSRKI